MAIRASAAACDITPDESLPLAGWTGKRRLSDGTGYPLYASAIHIRGGAGGIIIISLDLYSLAASVSQKIREQVASATGTREENVFVAVTGCTSAPYTEQALYLRNDQSYAEPNDDYLEHVIEMSVKSASEAAVSSRPASVAIIPFDAPGTGTFIVKGENGRVIGAVIVDDDVPDYLGPDNTRVSADFVGAAREALIAKFGGDPVIAYISAPAADHILKERESYGEEQAKTAAAAFTSALIGKLKGLKASDFDPNCSVGGELIDLYSLPRRDLPELTDASALLNAAVKMAGETAAQDEVQRRFARWAAIEANRTMSMVIAFKEGRLETSMQEYDPVFIQSVKVGSLRIIGLPCSVLKSCAQQILTQTGSDTWLAQGVNGTLMGSVLSCGHDDAEQGRLLSAVFGRDVAGRLIASVVKAAAKEQ